MPRPIRGYWVERRDKKFADVIYKCSRPTCSPRDGSTSAVSGGRRVLDDSLSCWDITMYSDENNVEACNSDTLLCTKGSRGALCGSCETNYVFSSADRICISCSVSQGRAVLVLSVTASLVFLCLVLAAWMRRYGIITKFVQKTPLWGVLKQVDNGALRVAWSNYQIVQSVTWNIDVSFPSPFQDFLSMLSFFSFDFVSLDCFFDSTSHLVGVLLWAFAPIVVALFLVVFHVGRSLYSSDSWARPTTGKNKPEDTNGTSSSLSYQLMLLGYLVVPPVSLKLFQALDCVTVANRSYLRPDTSVDCSSFLYRAFVVVDVLLVIIYLSIPLIWLVLLLRKRAKLNPVTMSDVQHAVYLRDTDRELDELRFLFASYKPSYFYAEVVEMYRRTIMIGILPLLAASTALRAVLGEVFALMSLVCFRETEPFLQHATNLLAAVSQYCVLVTFGAALIIETGISQGLNSFAFGCALVLCNISIAAVIAFVCIRRFAQEERERAETEAGRARTIEWAVGFSDTKFQTTLEVVEERHVPPTHCLMYLYCTFEEAQYALGSGIPATKDSSGIWDGIMLTLHRPYELDADDQFIFEHQDAALVVSCPWHLLQPLQQTDSRGSVKSKVVPETLFSSKSLWVLPSQTLTGLRGGSYGGLADAEEWYNGIVHLPPNCIVRAYRLIDKKEAPQPTQDEDSGMDPTAMKTPSRHGAEQVKDKLNEDVSTSILRKCVDLRMSSNKLEEEFQIKPPSSCLDFVNQMSLIRNTGGIRF